MQFDKDAVYIDIGRVNYTKKENLDLPKKGDDDNEDNGSDEESSSSSSEEEDIDLDAPAGLLKSLQDVKEGVDQKMKYSSLRLFKGSKAVKAGEDDDDGQVTNKSQQRRPVDDAFELANSFRRRFDEDDVENENSGSDSESSDDDSSDSERDDDDDSGSDDDSRNSDSEEEDIEDEVASEDGSGSDSEDEEMEEEKPTWKTNIAQQAAMNYLRRDRSIKNLQQLVYGGSSLTNSNLVSDEEENDLGKDGSDDDEDSDEEFFTLRNKSKQTSDSSKGEAGQSVINDIQLGEMDSSRKMPSGAPGIAFGVEAWLEEGDNCLIESIRDKFVTGNWGGNGEDEEGEKFDDFEDLEAGEKYDQDGQVLEDSDDDDEATAGMSDAQLREFNAKKKAAQKSGFDDDYDESKKGNVGKPGDEQAENEYVEALKREKEARLKRNEEEFGADGESSRLRFEGFRQGIYCRVRIDGIPAEFIESFDPTMPLVIGGLTPQETERGLVRCRFKKHRWHKKILKCNDPLVFSIGWRRFQSIPVFSTEDQNGRYRYLKYTPEHMHCQATFYGPQAPPNTGVSASRLLVHCDRFLISHTHHLCFNPPFSDSGHPTAYWEHSRLPHLCNRCGVGTRRILEGCQETETCWYADEDLQKHSLHLRNVQQ